MDKGATAIGVPRVMAERTLNRDQAHNDFVGRLIGGILYHQELERLIQRVLLAGHPRCDVFRLPSLVSYELPGVLLARQTQR